MKGGIYSFSDFEIILTNLSSNNHIIKHRKNICLQVGKPCDLTGLLPLFNRYRTPEEAPCNPEIYTAIKCIRAEGIKTAVLTNNWLLSHEESHCPVDRSLFDVVNVIFCSIFLYTFLQIDSSAMLQNHFRFIHILRSFNYKSILCV